MSTKISERLIFTLMSDAAFVLYMLAAFVAGAAFGFLCSIAYSALAA